MRSREGQSSAETGIDSSLGACRGLRFHIAISTARHRDRVSPTLLDLKSFIRPKWRQGSQVERLPQPDANNLSKHLAY